MPPNEENVSDTKLLLHTYFNKNLVTNINKSNKSELKTTKNEWKSEYSAVDPAHSFTKWSYRWRSKFTSEKIYEEYAMESLPATKIIGLVFQKATDHNSFV